MGKYRRELKQNEVKNENKERMKIAIGAAAVLAVGGGIVGFAISQNHNDLYGSYCMVGEHDISKLEYEFFYNSTVNNFLGSYGAYASYMGLDVSKPFKDQKYSDDMNWEQYFQTQALELMKEVYVLADAANADGFKMKQETYDNFYRNVDEYASEYKLSSKEYLKQMYGPHATKKNIETILKTYFLASDYATHLQTVKFLPSDSAIESYYQEHMEDYDKISYRIFSFPAEPVKDVPVSADKETDKGAEKDSEKESSEGKKKEEAEEVVEYSDKEWAAAMSEAKAKASEFYEQVYDEETYKELCIRYAKNDTQKKEYEEHDASLQSGKLKAEISPAIIEWLMDGNREYKATSILEDATNHVYHVVFFVDRYRDETPTVDVRHILISPEEVTPIGENATEEEKAQYEKAVSEAKANAKSKADEVFAEWKNGEATEKSFGKLANEKSADHPAGGLYEGVNVGEMVPAFNDWIYNKDRKPGDTDIVETEFGYHIMYFVGQNKPKWSNDVEKALISRSYNEFIKNNLEKLKFKDIKGELEFLGLYDYDQSHPLDETTPESTGNTEQAENPGETEVPETTEGTATEAPKE